jgi:hypothetical protein
MSNFFEEEEQTTEQHIYAKLIVHAQPARRLIIDHAKRASNMV